MESKLKLCFLLLLCFISTIALNNGVARTPPMGWLAWERFACNIDCENDPDNCISEKLFKEMADHLVTDGFKELGYEYVNIDDCWSSMQRDAQGRLQADKSRFPNGIKALADYVHGKGLKLGIYADYGTKTCGGYPGSINNLELDIKTFAEWGVDMLKMDGCNSARDVMPKGYKLVSQYLNATGRPIVFSCSWPAYWSGAGMKINYTFAAESCNLWRNYKDVQDNWDSIVGIINYYTSHQDEFQPIAGPGNWNDPDMLISGDFGLSVYEQRAQFAAWSALAAPLFMSNDLRNLDSRSKAILQNKEIIAVNQDRLGKQAKLVASGTKYMILSKELSNGSYAVVFINTESFSEPRNITVDLKTVGLSSKSALVRDLFAGKDISTYSDQYTAFVDPSGAVMVTMTPIKQ